MLLVLIPWTSVLLLVWVSHCTFSLFASTNKITLEVFAVLPYLSTIAIHIGIPKFASIGLSKVSKIVSALAFKNTVYKVTLVVAAVGPFIPSFAVFLTVLEMAFVPRLIGLPALTAEAVLTVINPVALISVTFEI